MSREDRLLKSLEPLLFPDDEDTDEGQFLSEVLSAVERWFRHSGWPNSVNLITVPDSLRRYHIICPFICRYHYCNGPLLTSY